MITFIQRVQKETNLCCQKFGQQLPFGVGNDERRPNGFLGATNILFFHVGAGDKGMFSLK